MLMDATCNHAKTCLLNTTGRGKHSIDQTNACYGLWRTNLRLTDYHDLPPDVKRLYGLLASSQFGEKTLVQNSQVSALQSCRSMVWYYIYCAKVQHVFLVDNAGTVETAT